ncbi:MAG: hypothetical protein GWN62_12960 [Aliifodinibius sp.]|nr:hypothetical protein [Fodinibius sp.]
MNFITDVLGTSLGKTIEGIGNTVRKFVTTDQDRMAAQIEIEALLQKRDSVLESTIQKELEAKERILVAELQQGDSYTKRARPTVVYFGLGMIFINYCVIPLVQYWSGKIITPFDLPTEFWVAWGGIVATWSIGRTSEKRGTRNKVTSFITGS